MLLVILLRNYLIYYIVVFRHLDQSRISCFHIIGIHLLVFLVFSQLIRWEFEAQKFGDVLDDHPNRVIQQPELPCHLFRLLTAGDATWLEIQALVVLLVGISEISHLILQIILYRRSMLYMTITLNNIIFISYPNKMFNLVSIYRKNYPLKASIKREVASCFYSIGSIGD